MNKYYYVYYIDLDRFALFKKTFFGHKLILFSAEPDRKSAEESFLKRLRKAYDIPEGFKLEFKGGVV